MESSTVTQGLETDRRTFVQTSTVAGAGALGLGAVTADPDADHYVVASDAHLGSPFANPSAFEQFLSQDVPALDPDVLVIAGDCFEMWFRGMSSVLLEYSNVAECFELLESNGTEVVLVAGNHDKRLVTVGDGYEDAVAPGSPWEIGEEFFFESGNQEFVAVHGDGPDPVQIDPISKLLCTQPDPVGALLAALLDWWEGLKPWTQVGETGSAVMGRSGLSLVGSYKEPVVLTAGSAGEPVLSPTDAGGIELRGGEFGDKIHYAVFESGRHTLSGGTAVEAGLTTTTGDWQTVTFAEPFDSPPVVVADVQTARGRRVTPGRTRRPARRSTAVSARPTVRNVTPMGFELRLDGRAEVGFTAVERGDISAHGRQGIAGVGAADDLWSFDTPVFTTAQTSSGGVTGYLALAGDSPLRASDSTTVTTPDAERLVRSEWQRRLQRADLTVPESLSEQPPGMVGLEPMSGDDESITDSLLDTYEEFVVFGHVHRPQVGDRYANSGSWTSRSPSSEPENTYLEIQDGEVTLWDWSPDGREQIGGT